MADIDRIYLDNYQGRGGTITLDGRQVELQPCLINGQEHLYMGTIIADKTGRPKEIHVDFEVWRVERIGGRMNGIGVARRVDSIDEHTQAYRAILNQKIAEFHKNIGQNFRNN